MLWELGAGTRPYMELSTPQVLMGLITGTLQLNWPTDGSVYEPLRRLAMSCVDPDPAERPTFEMCARLLTRMALQVRTVMQPIRQRHNSALSMQLATVTTGGSSGNGSSSRNNSGSATSNNNNNNNANNNCYIATTLRCRTGIGGAGGLPHGASPLGPMAGAAAAAAAAAGLQMTPQGRRGGFGSEVGRDDFSLPLPQVPVQAQRQPASCRP